MSNTVSLMASQTCTTNQVDTNKDAYENSLYVNNGLWNYAYRNYETSVFFDTRTIDDNSIYTFKYFVDRVDLGSYSTNNNDTYITIGAYNTQQTRDSVAWNCPRTEIGRVSKPTVGGKEIQLSGAQIKRGIVLYTYRDADNSIYEIDAEIGRITQGAPYAPMLEYNISEATISNITATATYIDNVVPIVWTSTNQRKFELKVLNGENEIYSMAGNRDPVANIPRGSINATGVMTVKVRVANSNLGQDFWSEWKQTSVTFTRISPTITSLEPNNIPQNRDTQIIISFDGINYDNWALKVKQNDSVIRMFEGSTAKRVILEPNTVSVGNVTLELVANRMANLTTATKTSNFEAYGKPLPPLQDITELYDTSTPIFTWESAEQTQYNIIIETDSGEIIEQKTETSTDIKSYTVKAPLTNNTYYKVRVRVRNKWNLWSDYSVKRIYISYQALPKPVINGYIDGFNAKIEISSPGVSLFKCNTVLRSTDGIGWLRIANNLKANDAITDYTLVNRAKYYYKIRSVGVGGQLADSDIITLSTGINDYVITDCTHPTRQLYINCEPKSSFKRNKNIAYNVFAGNSKPTVEFGIENFVNMSLKFMADYETYTKYLEMLNTNSVICMRDYMGRKFFGFIVNSPNEDYIEYIDEYNISLELVEVEFDENDMLFSNGLSPIKTIYLDGKYKLDGSMNLNGVI